MSYNEASPLTNSARTSTRPIPPSPIAPPSVTGAGGGTLRIGSFATPLPFDSNDLSHDLLHRASRNLALVGSDAGSAPDSSTVSHPFTRPCYPTDPQTTCQSSVGSLGDVGGPLHSARASSVSDCILYSPYDPTRQMGPPPLPTRHTEAAGASSDAPGDRVATDGRRAVGEHQPGPRMNGPRSACAAPHFSTLTLLVV